MKISNELMGYIRSELECLQNGRVTIELAETSKKTDVVTTAEIANAGMMREKVRSIEDPQMEEIGKIIELVRYGRVTIQAISGEPNLDIIIETRKRFTEI